MAKGRKMRLHLTLEDRKLLGVKKVVLCAFKMVRRSPCKEPLTWLSCQEDQGLLGPYHSFSSV